MEDQAVGRREVPSADAQITDGGEACGVGSGVVPVVGVVIRGVGMPFAPKRPCAHPGCPELTINGRCKRHKRQERKEVDNHRQTSAQRGYDSKWQQARAAYLKDHPLCVACRGKGRLVAATVVDHIKPHKGNKIAFWDRSNWQSLCGPCHSSKTVRDGRWGYARA